MRKTSTQARAPTGSTDRHTNSHSELINYRGPVIAVRTTSKNAPGLDVDPEGLPSLVVDPDHPHVGAVRQEARTCAKGRFPRGALHLKS